MRFAAILLTVLLASFSGCLESGDDPEAMTDEPTAPVVNGTAMAPLHFEGDVPFGTDPFNVVPVQTPAGGGVPCSTPASTCFIHAFTIPEGVIATVEATLAWSLPANDFDLYLYQEETQLSSDGINSIPPAADVPSTTQVLHYEPLVPGDYDLWVVAWNSVADAYTLDATFTTEPL